MSHHELMIAPHWFDRLADGTKTAEVRKHDRDYQPGDTLTFLREDWNNHQFGRVPTELLDARISHILPASVFPDGLQPGYSLLSLTHVGNRRPAPKKEDVA